MRGLLGLLCAATAVAQFGNTPVGIVDFYGLHDLDANALRAAISVRPGDKLEWPATRERLRADLVRAAGRTFNQFDVVCCDGDQRLMIYIGFGGKSPEFRKKPGGDARLQPELSALYDEFMAAVPAALKHQAGKPEDYSKGYSLFSHAPMRSIQLRMREAALAQEREILDVLANASEDRQRIAAAHFAGYMRQCPEQIAALVDASRDPNETVRNNATRALGVLAATPQFARQIPAAPFIDRLNSPVWSDRNKALMLLRRLTQDRDPQVLARLKADALPSLIEMARWQFSGHSGNAIRLLGRIAGMDEETLEKLADAGEEGPLLAALGVK